MSSSSAGRFSKQILWFNALVAHGATEQLTLGDRKNYPDIQSLLSAAKARRQ